MQKETCLIALSTHREMKILRSTRCVVCTGDAVLLPQEMSNIQSLSYETLSQTKQNRADG